MNLKINYSAGRNKSLLKKLNIKVLILLFLPLLGFTPLIADQLANQNSSSTNQDTSTVLSSITPSPEIASPMPSGSISDSATPSSDNKANLSPSPSPEQTNQVNTSEATNKASPTPSKTPPFAIANQKFTIKMPRVLRVDPRAKKQNIPVVNFYSEGSPYLMLCSISSRGLLDVGIKGLDDSYSGNGIFISGDQSQVLQISGASSHVLDIFNSFGGFQIRGPNNQAVSGTNVLFKFVAISEPTDNFQLCSQSTNSSQWLLEIQPLGLSIDTKKNNVTLGDKKKTP